MGDSTTLQSIDSIMEHRTSRRRLLQRAMALSLSVPVASALLAACAEDDDDAPVVDPDTDDREDEDDSDDVPETDDVVEEDDTEEDDTEDDVDSDEPRAGGTFVFSHSEFQKLVPATGTGHTTWRLLANIYEGLVREDLHDEESQSLATAPWLAESWDISDDGLEYTFTLRQGVEFTDGTPFDANAVYANYQRHRDEDSVYFDPASNQLTAIFYGSVESGEVVDDYTWRYTLQTPFGEFIKMAESRLLLLISPTALEEYGPDDIEFNPVGTGPFKFVERQPGVRVILERNEDYWDGAPYLDRLIAEIMPDPQAQEAAIRAGDIDMMPEMLPDQLPVFEEDPNVDLRQQPVPHTWFWMFNNRDGETSEKLVRQALHYAWDRDAMVALVNNIIEPAVSPIPPANVVYPPTSTPYEYDVDRARELLDEAGYPDGFDLKLMLGEAYGGGGINTVAMNEQLQADFAEIGVNVDLDVMESTTFLELARQGLTEEYGALQTNWFTDSHLGFYIEAMFSTPRHAPAGNNRGWYSNPEVDELVVEARQAPTLEEAIPIYREALDIIVEEAPWLWIGHSIGPVAVRSDVRGLSLSASPFWDFHPVWLDRDE